MPDKWGCYWRRPIQTPLAHMSGEGSSGSGLVVSA